MEKFNVDRDSTVIINGDIRNVKYFKIDRECTNCNIKGSVSGCKSVEVDRSSKLEIKGSVRQTTSVNASRGSTIIVNGELMSNMKKEQTGGTIKVAVEREEEEEEENKEESFSSSNESSSEDDNSQDGDVGGSDGWL